MASSKIKGITIEIGGNTTKLENALKDVNRVVYSTNNELKELNKALKLDPKNTELLAQKQELLKKNIEATTTRLNALKTAQQQMGNYNRLTDAQKESYRALSVEITKAESSLKGMQKELKETSRINLDGLKKGLKNVGEVAGQVLTTVAKIASTIGAALSAVVAAGVKSYASLEQNIGGVETMFGKSAEKVIKNAQEAYKTIGISANEYMQNVTSFSASLIKSLGGDTEKAADVADMALKDMADNANKFGTDMSSIQNAYQGFAKQQYQLLDNLKLGYGGTKKEMERLLKDAQKLSGVKYDINNLNDIYQAIHVIQEEMGVTGTTAKEASETISGSVNTMKAAFDNFLNGSGSPDALADSVLIAFKNIAKAIKQLAPKILKGLVDVMKEIAPTIVETLTDLAPELIDAALDLMENVLKTISENVQPIVDTIIKIMNNIANFTLKNLPMIFKTGLQILLTLLKGITDNIDEIIPAIVDVILEMVDTLLDNIDLIIEAGIKLIIGLAEGLIKGVPKLIAKIPEIIAKIVKGFVDLMPNLFELGGKMLDKLLEGFKNIGTKVKEAVRYIWEAIKKGFRDILPFGHVSNDVYDELLENVPTASTTAGLSNINNPSNSNSTKGSNVSNITINIDKYTDTSSSGIQGFAQELGYYMKQNSLAKGGK